MQRTKFLSLTARQIRARLVFLVVMVSAGVFFIGPTLTAGQEKAAPHESNRADETSTETTDEVSKEATDEASKEATDEATSAPPSDGHQVADAAGPSSVVEDWEEPKFVVFASGRQHGYIEPCGCSGLDKAKGGLSRRDSLLTELRGRGWSLVPVDVGNQVRRFGKQADIKFQRTVDMLDSMGYEAIGFGPDDLRLSLGGILAPVAESGKFVCANVDMLGLNVSHRVITVNGHRIGIVGFLGEEAQRKITASDEIVISDLADSLQKILDSMQSSPPEFMVLLAHASLDETRELVGQFPQSFDIVVTAGGAGEPTLEPEKVPGTRSQIVQVGTKGMYVGLIGVFADEEHPVRYQRVALDARFPDSQRILTVFADYQNQLKHQGLEGLGVKPQPHPRGEKFVSTETCGECHTEAMAVFEKSPHHDATQSLIHPTERSEIPRSSDPECLSCHVTGWNPQEYFPFVSGYLSVKETSLYGNGCENCHGPGSAHVAAENGEGDLSDEEIQRLREQMRLTVEQAKETSCYTCHDLDNSPDFDFETYWPEVEHHGVD